MEDLLVIALSGLVSGALYALLATGLVLSYSASGLFNFAHGATAYLCALVFYEVRSGLGWPAVPAALLVVLVLAPGLGWALDRLMFQPAGPGRGERADRRHHRAAGGARRRPDCGRWSSWRTRARP